MNITIASSMINRLNSLFAIYEFPNSMLTDNGPPWNSTDIKLFFKARRIKHKRITPLWPRANGLTERFMQNINTCITSKTNWKENLQLMLMNYRNTPHHITGIAPSTLFFNKQPRSFIPGISAKKEKPPNYSQVKNKQKHSQEKLTFTNEHKTSKFKVGDQVLLKKGCTRNKFESRYYPEAYYIINIKGDMISVINKSKVSYSRDVSLLKLYVNDVNSK